MSITTQIQLGNKGYLETSAATIIPITFNIANIKDISKKLSATSLSINLPSNSNNDKLFEHLWNVNITTGTFDINKKEDIIVLQNGVPVFTGFLQLTDIKKTKLTEGTASIEYICVIKDNVSDFYTALSDNLLTDLDLTKYNHLLNLTNIEASFTNDYKDGYKYHLSWIPNDYYSLQDFSPSVYALTYLDLIFRKAGYSYTINNPTSIRLNKLLIPFNGDNSKVDFQLGTIEDRLKNTAALRFKAGYTAAQTPFEVVEATSAGNVNHLMTIKFDDDSTAPNTDPSGIYNNITGTYTSNVNDIVSFKTKFNVRAYLQFPTDVILWPSGNYAGIKSGISVNLNYSLIDNVGKVYHPSNATQSIFDNTSSSWGNTIYNTGSYNLAIKDFEFETAIQVSVGDIITQFLGAELNIQGIWTNLFGIPISDKNDLPSLYFEIATVSPTDPDVNTYFITPNGIYMNDTPINMNNFIPKNVKQKDFVSSLTKMFNLYFTVDPLNNKNIIIETRDNFYDRGDVDDWTYKFDNETETNIAFLPELQSKRIILTHKDDKDLYNQKYKEATNEVYGQVNYSFNNEFVQGEQKIETIFSATPLDNVNNGNRSPIVPIIPSRNPNCNIRILYDGGVISGNWNLNTSLNIGGIPTIAVKNTYPYVGHFDNPYDPKFDINFSQPQYLYYEYLLDSFQDSGLFNNYYARQFEQIQNGKLMTAKIALTETDILNFKFNKKIWIKDCYWYVNKISNYDANDFSGLTTVEFISVEKETDFNPQNFTRKFESDINRNTNKSYIQQFKQERSNDYNYNYSTEQSVQINGTNNIVQSLAQNIIITGDANIVAGVNNTISGNYNYLAINGSSINGNENTTNNIVNSQEQVMVNNINVTGSKQSIIDIPSAIYISDTNGKNTTIITDAINVTNSELNLLILNNGLVSGAKYVITDNFGQQIILTALSNNLINVEGQRTLLCPINYTTGVTINTFTSLGIWTAALLPVINNLVIWGGRFWQSITGTNSNIPSSHYELDSTEWQLLDKNNIEYYVFKSFKIEYNVKGEYVAKQYDDYGNIVGSGESSEIPGSGGLTNIDITDWNVVSNEISPGIFQIFRNNIGNLFVNNLGNIYDNKCSVFNNSSITSVYSNNLVEVISDNICSDIYLNSRNGQIRNNTNSGTISNNIGSGDITFNTNPGNIVNNSNFGVIDSNGGATGNIAYQTGNVQVINDVVSTSGVPTP